jgi:hypothetical protein
MDLPGGQGSEATMATENGNGTTALARVGDVAPAGGAALAKKGEWDKLAFEPANWDQAFKVATVLFKSGVLPDNIKSPEAAVAIVMRGRELGMTAMQALTSIHVVKGKTGLSADLMAALILQSGLADYFEPAESSDTKAVYVTKRKGRPEKSQTWTIEMAKAAGVYQTNDVWKKYPAAMLRHRAASDLAKSIYPEVVLGLYDPEEIESEQMPPPPSAEGVRAVEMLHADIARVRTEVEAAAQNMSPAHFERITGAPLTKLQASPVSALRKAHEALTAAGAFRAPEQAAQAPVVIDAQVVTSTPTPVLAPKAEPTKVELTVVPTTSTTQSAGPDANQSPSDAQNEPADGEPSDTADGGGEEEPPPHDPETGEVLEPEAPAEVEVTVAMLSAANTAARKKNIDAATAAWKAHHKGRKPTELSNPEKVALLRELESIGGGS